MASALGFILNAAGLFVPIALEAEYAKLKPKESTSVQIIVGSGDSTTGGTVPHVALWDDDGSRIGQYSPGAKDTIGEGDVKTIIVEHSQTVPKYKQADPYYVMLSNQENNAICIAAITVANQKISGTFYGDTGYTCGQSWFLSQNRIGSNFEKPRCVWLDADHTNKINARALSFHLNDMASSQSKLDEYADNKDTLCKSTPRFSIWGNLLPNGVIPFFNPKLEYLDDGTSEGADKDPQRVIDKNNQYDKSVYLHLGENHHNARQSRRSISATSANHNPEHLIITDHAEDNVRELCEHPNSYGWDIVSTSQGLFCDMEHKQLYPLCSATIKDNCFDLNKKVIISKDGLGARDEFPAYVPLKNYTSHQHWKN
ncbi:Uncharacterized protein BP5553_02225 [Venustampulla echinocandica]|uniref:Uncharacterized protein n=1 Tax=Venustampulla echinocandica TaxID=2656787 RepID=A0A370U388_9HELO|nr:Uncharacterized protein BP5553_02225 [Venustampulla echinocandica]RDL42246.1 Uncharacterized protein BP5553_02225 [Venustampulla echinocandica]